MLQRLAAYIELELAAMTGLSSSLRVADVLQFVADAASDQKKQARLKRMELRQFQNIYYCDSNRNEYLLEIPGEMREEPTRYYFFAVGYMFEIHPCAYPNKYSFISFPKDLEEERAVVQERFIAAAQLSGVCMAWWEGMKWNDLSEELKAYLHPVFVQDDVKAFNPL